MRLTHRSRKIGPRLAARLAPRGASLVLSCLGLALLGSCATTAQKTASAPSREEGRDAPAERATLSLCAATSVPEAVLALGMAATVPNPLAPLAAAGYYGAVLYRCHGALTGETVRRAEIEALRRETTARIERSKEEVIKNQTLRVDALVERIDAVKASEAARLGDARRAVDGIVSETEARVRRAADEAVRDVYRQMDEIRRVKIQVVDDEP